jgi:hypothetical protein
VVGNGQTDAPQQNIPSREAAPAGGDGRQGEGAQQESEASTQREASPLEQEDEASREVAILAGQDEVSSLQEWGENLEGAALMVLALGEVVEGVALLLQAFAYFRNRDSASLEDHEVQEHGEEVEEQHNGEESRSSVPKKLGEAGAFGVSSLTHVLDRKKGEEIPLMKDQDEKARTEGKDEGRPSFLGKFGEAASHSVSSLKDALSHMAGDGASSQQGLASLEQWGIILEGASTLMQDLGKLSKQKEKTGLASMGKWLKIYRSAHSLVDELKQTCGGGVSSPRGGSGVLSKIGGMLGDGTASEKEKDEESSEKDQGGASSALKALAGHSPSKKEGGEGGGLLDALTGEDSPLQTLREFSKRQQGPGGLAPKGPIGRKPPPGPMRRDRLAGTKS